MYGTGFTPFKASQQQVLPQPSQEKKPDFLNYYYYYFSIDAGMPLCHYADWCLLHVVINFIKLKL